MSNPATCKTCRKLKANHTCDLCQAIICKSCTQFLSESFSFKKIIPKELTHSSYCMNCFDDHVATPLNIYNQTVEAAKEIIIYSTEQTKLTRFLKRKAEPYRVENCEDEEEALMRMSFFAVEANYNCLIDVHLTQKKIVVGSHKKAIWSGTAVPVIIDPSKIRGHIDPP